MTFLNKTRKGGRGERGRGGEEGKRGRRGGGGGKRERRGEERGEEGEEGGGGEALCRWVLFVTCGNRVLFLCRFVFPQWLLSSHFLTTEQKKLFSRARYDSRVQQFRTLADDVKQSASREQLRLLENLKEQVCYQYRFNVCLCVRNDL